MITVIPRLIAVISDKADGRKCSTAQVVIYATFSVTRGVTAKSEVGNCAQAFLHPLHSHANTMQVLKATCANKRISFRIGVYMLRFYCKIIDKKRTI